MIRNPVSWCVWAVAALAVAFLDRSPVLQALLLLVLINVWLPYRNGRPTYLRFGVALGLVPVIFSVALSRFGSHVIMTLPSVPVIGGRWTSEAVLFGASSGAALLLTVMVFGIVQVTVRSADLVALLPRPLYRAGTAFALSVAFAPRAIASYQAIQQARALRAQRTGWRAAPAVVVPLLLTTLEQALQYGESLDARGYGNVSRSRYRPIIWRPADVVVVLIAMASLVLTVRFLPPPYDPYQNLVPAAPPWLSIAAIVLLAAPALLVALSPRRR